MASLEPPSRPYITSEADQTQLSSARTSMTHLNAPEDGTRPATADGVTAPQVDLAQDATMTTTGAEETKTTTEGSTPSQNDGPTPQVPQVHITFLLITGRRKTMTFEPETTVGRVKELIWNAWPSDWDDDRPVGPSYIRVLYLGKMLQDDDTLATHKFPTNTPQTSPTPTPTIVHLSVRPYAPQPEADPKKNKRSRTRSGDSGIVSTVGNEEESAAAGGCCGCIIC